MRIESNPIQSAKKGGRLPLLLVIIIFLAVGIGYYAWRQQQNALMGLKTLEDSGVTVTFFIRSRPLLVVEANKKRLFLISGRNPQDPLRLPFHSIRQITFKEARTSSASESEPKGSGDLIIETTSGQKYRVGDLPWHDAGARKALRLFEKNHILTDRLVYKSR